MALAGEPLFKAIREAFAKHHWVIQPIATKIVPAQCGNLAGMVGAAAAARRKRQHAAREESMYTHRTMKEVLDDRKLRAKGHWKLLRDAVPRAQDACYD